MEELKEFLHQQLDGDIDTYEAGNLDELCTAVADRLERAILEELARTEGSTDLALERKAQSAFARNRRHCFKGRKRVLESVLDYMNGSDARPLVLQGVSGCGKSAIMAQSAALAGATGRRAVSIRRFVGVTPASSNGLTLLQSICEEIATRYNQPAETPGDFSMAVNAFRDRLTQATAEKPLRLFIDALDQLDPHDPAMTLTWVPAALPPHCRIVVSTNNHPLPFLDAKVVQVGLFPPEDAHEIISAWLNDARRTLQAEQRDLLLAFFKRSGLPLYFKLAFGEARLWRSFDPPERCVLAEGIEGIIDVLFERLGGADHGPVLVPRSLGYLAASRFGLTEDEILEALTDDQSVWKDCVVRHFTPQERRLPPIIWSRLHFDLEPYLTERAVRGGTTISFFHRQLREAAYSMSPSPSSDAEPNVDSPTRIAWRAGLHGALADLFSRKETRQGPINERKVSELPYQLTLAGHWDRLDKLMGDLDFGAAKIEAELLFDFVEDCDRALRVHSSEVVKTISTAIKQDLFSLARDPKVALQTLRNRLRWIPTFEAETRRIDELLDNRGFWVCAKGPLPSKESHMVFAESRPHQHLSLSGQSIAAAGFDGVVEFRHLESGELRLTRSVGAKRLVGMACSSDYGRLAWLEQTGTIHSEGTTEFLQGRSGERRLLWHPRLGIIAVRQGDALCGWNPVSGEITLLVANIPSPLTVLRLTDDGSALIYVAGDQLQMAGILVLNGEISHISIPNHEAPIVDADLDPKTGLLLLLTRDRMLRLIHAETGVCQARLAYETNCGAIIRGRPIRCALGGDEGATAYFATGDGHVVQWDTLSGSVNRLPDYCTIADRSSLSSFTYLPKSKDLFLSTDSFGAFWTRRSADQPAESHPSSVSLCCFTPAGNIVTASRQANTLICSSPNLELRSRIIERHASAIACGMSNDEVIIGDQQGRVWTTDPAGHSINRGMPVAVLLREPVLWVFHDQDDYVIAAGESGRVVRIPLFQGNTAEVLFSEKGHREQRKVIPAGAGAAFWSLRRQSAEGGVRTVFSLVRKAHPELEVLNTPEFFGDAASTADGTIAGVAGRSVRLFSYDGVRLQPLYRRDSAVDMIAFLENRFVLVSMPDQPWLEVWQIREGLPTVAALHVTSPVSAMATSGWNAAVGLRSGGLLSLQLRGEGER